ncbi:MAG: pyruvate kinase [Holosporaceae bacterium]|jgi:pyruvate kinase|nr:pyruvate kinase [Holosporaceae bacterium]
MRRCRNTKIVATIGPASCSEENLEKLFKSGVDVFRLNFSHGGHEGHAKVYEAIRSIGKKHSCYPTILADLQGPKLRVGTFEGDRIELKAGDVFRFDLDPALGNNERVSLPHPEIFAALHGGSLLLLDDGKLRFEVTDCGEEFANVKVLVGGSLSNKKGVNVPQVMLKIPALTEKDRKDLGFALNLGVDWVALSFVQRVEDVENAKSIINGKAGVISKLEKPMAIKALEPIVDVSDAVMIARGDLAVETSHEDVPVIQRQVLNACHRIGRPVIIATQMLESMITAPSPTRAEVSDVATAVYSGADATMLSAESASGQYPFEAVSTMADIITRAEADPYCIRRLEDDTQLPIYTTLDAICSAAWNAAEYSGACVLVLYTDSFEAAARCSRLRPRVPILLITESKSLACRVGLCNGITAMIAKKEPSSDVQIKSAKIAVVEKQFAQTGDVIVVLRSDAENSVTICRV